MSQNQGMPPWINTTPLFPVNTEHIDHLLKEEPMQETKRIDLMLDLETLAVGMNPALTQIAVTRFEIDERRVPRPPWVRELPPLYDISRSGIIVNIPLNLKSSLDAGLEMCPDTFKWWLKQKPEIIKSVLCESMTGGMDLKLALEQLNLQVAILRSRVGDDGEVNLWAWPATSDITWLQSAYKAVGVEWPFKYDETRCVKPLADTYYAITGKKIYEGIENANEHDALSDCDAQAAAVQKYFKWVKSNHIDAKNWEVKAGAEK